MCGIFGYLGNGNAQEILLKGLKRLESRGYDSAGMAILDAGLTVIRAQGKIESLEEKLIAEDNKGTLGIAHTRWATHGIPSERNAHPHICRQGGIAIVHNGIIENYHVLTDYLKSRGHTFRSDTDSEVLAHLIAEMDSECGNLFLALQKTLSMIQGTYGLAVIKEGVDEIFAAKNGSPLIIGLGTDAYFVSSDANAINDHTKDIIVLSDKEAARITRNGCMITDSENQEIEKTVEKITWDVKEMDRGLHPHFMHKEIHEQPETVKNAYRGRLGTDRIRLDGLDELERLAEETDLTFDNRFRRIRILACGTSWHSALIGKYLIENLARIPTEVDYSSEFRYRHPVHQNDELVIGISQSGETADTIEALRLAKKSNVTFGIVNVVGSGIARETSAGIYIHAGPEIGVASTKAFTGQVACLYLLATELGRKRGIIDYPAYRNELLTIPDKIATIISQENDIKEIAKNFSPHNNYLYLGRGINFPVALEGALKLKEISGIHAEGYPAAEMKHGPIALIDESMPVLFIATGKDERNHEPGRNGTYEKVLSNMHEVRSRNGRIIAIADHEDPRLREVSDHIIIIPETTESLSPLLNVIPLQILAYHTALFRGKNPDKPDNLAKAVTVE